MSRRDPIAILVTVRKVIATEEALAAWQVATRADDAARQAKRAELVERAYASQIEVHVLARALARSVTPDHVGTGSAYLKERTSPSPEAGESWSDDRGPPDGRPP